ILLKRGPSATVTEWLLAAEYLLAGGNPNVILFERGIRTFETDTRNSLDLAAVALAKQLSPLPVIADPSHGTGRRSLIPALSSAALAVGADGLMIEVHPCPERALSDGPQSLDLDGFASLMRKLAQPSRTISPVLVGGET
ncbi:MAG: 3-deoxy-7-phosphoheptulonate synthase, partial [Terriglobales bacterium]